MKVKRMRNGYALRLNDSEYLALTMIIGFGYPEARAKASMNTKRGMAAFENGLEVTDDRRSETCPGD